MTVDNAFELAHDDVVRGLSPAFEPLQDAEGDGFEMSHHFRDTEVMSGEQTASVVWTYRCKHVEQFGHIPATGQVLTIRGVTVVDTRKGDPLFHRYIDWLAVYSALGYTLYQRQMVDQADWSAINAAKRDA